MNPNQAFSEPFSIARLPRIEFGANALDKLPEIARRFGTHALCVTGARSLLASPAWSRITSALESAGMRWQQVAVSDEPSPEWVDTTVNEFRDQGIDVVIGIGGGSAMDAAKSVAGLLRLEHSVMDFLEGVGPELSYPGPAVPLIACPTTAGTGSEATKNGVLSQHGASGFKKSFRDEQLVPEFALIDPALLETCPQNVIAANGMDALTQVLESYVSLRANHFNNALGARALIAIREALLAWYENGAQAREAQARMAFAALISGINLAQTGLGSVHGLASPLGAFFPIPHGVVCGTLVAECTRVNIERMRAREPDNRALSLYAEAATHLIGEQFDSLEQAHSALIDTLTDWTEKMRLPRLAEYGVSHDDVPRIVANSRGSSMKTNPILLTDEDIVEILYKRI